MVQKPKYTGLTAEQVIESRREHGTNVLTPASRRPWYVLFLEKFRDPLIVILLIAGVLSIGISVYEYECLGGGVEVFFEPLGIIIAIILATGLAFYFEQKADSEFAILNKVSDDEPVVVVRNGGVHMSVPRKDVVVGDIVVLTTGQEIPADGKLLEAVTMNVDESTLTGEPIAHKSINPDDFDPEATFDTDAVLRGTKVMEGHGVMRVTAVGDATENGRVFTAAQIDDSVRTPLDDQLDRLGKLIARASYVIGALIIVGRVIMYFTTVTFEWISFITYLLQTLMIAVTLVVVSVPEGLPMAVTLSLAYSMRRMLRTNNLVRKLHACETMGATTVICTDKTGTLTENQMRVYRMDFFGPEDLRAYAIDNMAVNSTAELNFRSERTEVLGNPTEGALLLWLKSHNVDYTERRAALTRVAELPFTTERKYMASVVRDNAGRCILYVKGAPEIVYAMCSNAFGLTQDQIDARLLEYQNMAMRTLGFAYAVIEGDGSDTIVDGKVNCPALAFEAIAAISDPVRADVPDAVREVLDAGINVKIVTGDTPATAKEIARQIGLWDDASDGDRNIITGREIEAMTDDELRSRVEKLKIIARARPMDKKRLVEALRDCGEVVAVTGDGTNDAPALKAAHVGLSMGDGTSVAKEASDITIIDNSFSSIGRAVMWGRSLYLNIQRFILFQLTVNVVACLVVLCGAFMGMQSPLTVTQMLWVNLIMDTFAALALSTLPPSATVMRDRPRPRTAFIINRAMWTRIIGVGFSFFAVLIACLYCLQHARISSLTDIFSLNMGASKSLSPYELSLFFTTFVFLQVWNIFNAKVFGSTRSALYWRHCGTFTAVVAAIFLGQIAIVEFGGNFFSVVPLSISDWLIIMGATSIVLWFGELYRALKRRHNP